jgi:hypothetical protein
LVCVEGTAEFLADRWSHPKTGKGAGLFAYQARHPEGMQQRLFRRATYSANRKIYLALFPDDGFVEEEVGKCLQRIETAIREGQLLCDLSDVGTDAAWAVSDHGIIVKWPIGSP